MNFFLNLSQGWAKKMLQCLSSIVISVIKMLTSYVTYRVQNILFFYSYLVSFFYTFSTMYILEDRSLSILDWEATVSNVVSMMLSGRTCLVNTFSLDRTLALMLCSTLCLENILSYLLQRCQISCSLKFLTVRLVRTLQQFGPKVIQLSHTIVVAMSIGLSLPAFIAKSRLIQIALR